MITITFYDEESVKKNFRDYEADCLVEICGSEADVTNILDCTADAFPNSWGSGSKNNFKGYAMVSNFSHYLDFVILLNDYFNQ